MDYINDLQSGNAWRRADAERMVRQLREETTIEGGVVRWKSNGRVPFGDAIALAIHAGIPGVDEEACARAREADTDAAIASYRANYKAPGPEQLAEMRAAFGPGETVVDVLTGHKIRL